MLPQGIVSSEELAAYEANFNQGLTGAIIAGNQTPGNIPLGLWRHLSESDKRDTKLFRRMTETMDMYLRLYALAPKGQETQMRYQKRYLDMIEDKIPFIVKNANGENVTTPVAEWSPANPLIVTLALVNDAPIQTNTLINFPQLYCVGGSDAGNQSVARAKELLTDGSIKYSPFYLNIPDANNFAIASLFGAPVTAIVLNTERKDSYANGFKRVTLKILGFDNELMEHVINGVADNRSAAASPIAPADSPGVTLAQVFGDTTNRNMFGGVKNGIADSQFADGYAYASLRPYATTTTTPAALKMLPFRIALDSIYTGSEERAAIANKTPSFRFEQIQRYREFMSASVQTGRDIALAYNTRKVQAELTMDLLFKKINNALLSNRATITADENGELQYTFDGFLQRFPNDKAHTEKLTIGTSSITNYENIVAMAKRFFDLGQSNSVAVAFCDSEFINRIQRVLMASSKSHEIYNMSAWYGFNVQELRMPGGGGVIHLFPLRTLGYQGTGGTAFLFDPGTANYPTIRCVELQGDPFRFRAHEKIDKEDRETAEFRGTIGLEGHLDRAMKIQMTGS